MNSDDNALSEIHKGLALLYEKGDIVELRAFHQTHLDYPTTISGFFDDLDKLALAIQDVNSHTQKNGKKTRITVYTTLNPVKKTWQTVNNKCIGAANSFGLKSRDWAFRSLRLRA